MDNKAFRTTIKLSKSNINITHQSQLMLIGSCFVESIGEYLKNAKFTTLINPNGILYNPISIAKCLQDIVNQKIYTEEDLNFDNGKWFSFVHHGSFANSNQQQCLQVLNDNQEKCYNYLKNTDFLILTLGTAYAYQHEDRGIVGNCHKVDSKCFQRVLLSVDDIVERLQEIFSSIKLINSNIFIILTISPIRYIRYNFQENSLSKAHLLLSVERFLHSIKNVDYFPSFEIMMDDLRDYRFYADDMIHPSMLAIEYIWQQFAERYFNDNTKSINKLVDEIYSATRHRIMNAESTQTKMFAKNLLTKIDDVEKIAPYLNFEDEKLYFKQILN